MSELHRLCFMAHSQLRFFDFVTNLVGLGGIAIGIVPFLLNERRLKKKTELLK